MGTHTDEELMGLVQKQDTSAFEELFRRYDQRVLAFFWRLCANRQEAEDATQETFLRLWKARVRYEPSGKFSTYHFLHERQKQKTRAHLRLEASECPDEFLEKASPLGGAYDQVAADEIQAAIGKAVAHLPEIHRLVFVLSEEQRMSYREIANVMDCPVGTVSSRKVEAVKKLRSLLRPLADELSGESGRTE
jgi:RNA polymerase sigma-70 factor (ECF subfamily)